MAKKLMVELELENYCNEEMEYILDFTVYNLKLSEEGEEEPEPEELLILMSFDNNIFKFPIPVEDFKTFKVKKSFYLFCTPLEIFEKLKSTPIMFSVSKGMTELGMIQYDILECFASSVLCDTFQSQKDTKELIIEDQQGKENGSLMMCFKIRRNCDPEMDEVYKMISAEKRRIAMLRNKSYDVESSSSDTSVEIVDDDMMKFLKLDIDPNKKIYRIYNGNLINIREKMGPCKQYECPASKRIVKELKKIKPKTPENTARKFSVCENPECSKILAKARGKPKSVCHQEDSDTKCPMQQKCSYTFHGPKSRIDPTKDLNCEEEKLFKKLCGKFGLAVDESKKKRKTRRCQVKREEPESSSDEGFEDGEQTKRQKRECKKAQDKIKSVMDPHPCHKSDRIIRERKRFIELMKKRARGKFDYSFGKMRAIRQCNHEMCRKVEDVLVPKFMGWKWNRPIPGLERIRKNWRPGKVSCTVRRLMKHFLNPYPIDTIPNTKRDETGKIVGACPEINPCEDPRNMEQIPTLEIQKKDGEYSIKMHPLKEADKLGTACNPYLNSSPIIFRITKNPEAVKKHKAKKMLKEKGFEKKCPCLNFTNCRCMEEKDKKLMASEMTRVSNYFALKCPLRLADLVEESSDSELDVEFTTPSAVVKHPERCKPDVTAAETQYDINDFLLPSQTNKRVTSAAGYKKKAADKKLREKAAIHKEKLEKKKSEAKVPGKGKPSQGPAAKVSPKKETKPVVKAPK